MERNMDKNGTLNDRNMDKNGELSVVMWTKMGLITTN